MAPPACALGSASSLQVGKADPAAANCAIGDAPPPGVDDLGSNVKVSVIGPSPPACRGNGEIAAPCAGTSGNHKMILLLEQ